MSAIWNTIQLIVFVVVGLGVGFVGIERLTSNGSAAVHNSQTTGPEEVQVSLNTAILYATVALVLSGVVTEWPPEG